VRFDAEELEVAVHAAFGDFALGGRRAYAPVRATVLGLLVQGFANQCRDALLLNRARTPRAQLIVQPGDAMFQKAPAPLAHGRPRERIAIGDGAIGVTRRSPGRWTEAQHASIAMSTPSSLALTVCPAPHRDRPRARVRTVSPS
jgi:hypothetical protein